MLNSDKLPAFLLFVFLLAAYFYTGKIYYELGAYSGNNILFDTDAAWYVDAIGRDTADWQVRALETRATIWWKHPIMYGFRWLSLPLTYTGLSGPAAAILLTAIFSAATCCILLWTCLASGLGRTHSFLIAGLFSVSSVSVFRGGMPEAYAIVAFPVALLWLLLVRATVGQHQIPAWTRGAVGAFAAGTTLVFGALYAWIELLLLYCRNNRFPQLREIFSRKTLASPTYFAVFLIAAVFLVYAPYLTELFNAPVDSAKRLLWATVTHGEKVGPLPLFQAFFIYPLFAPEATIVPLEIEGKMADFREYLYPGWLLPFAVLFVSILIYGVFTGLRDRHYRMVTIGALGWLAFSFIFHLEYQYRGSVYLYAPHHWFAVFLLIIAGVRGLTQSKSRTMRLGAPAALILLLISSGWINVTGTLDLWDWLQVREAPTPQIQAP